MALLLSNLNQTEVNLTNLQILKKIKKRMSLLPFYLL